MTRTDPPGMRRPRAVRLAAWSLPAWAIVAIVWFMAVTRQPAALLLGLGIGLAALVVAWLVVHAWVGHNRTLARRREARYGGRRGAPDIPLVVDHDARGREIVLGPGARAARIVTVSVVDGRKVIAPERRG